MTRRSTPQKMIDDRAFPVRMLVVVPAVGFGARMRPLHGWLDREVGRTEHAVHGGGSLPGSDTVAIYFRDPGDAHVFLQAHPWLELADGTAAPWYSSPHLPFGRREEFERVCNLYSNTTTQEAMRQLFQHLGWQDRAGNLQPGEIYPDQLAPIVRHTAGREGLELVRARWGMPTPPMHMKTERDPGVTNIRNTGSPHWRRWLGPENRCLVPLTSFAEPRGKGLGNQWFAPADGGPAFFAGIETRGWRSVRKVKDGVTTDDLFAFLTTTPNAEVAAVHPKAMPVILTTQVEWETWLTAPWTKTRELQRPLPDGALRLVETPA